MATNTCPLKRVTIPTISMGPMDLQRARAQVSMYVVVKTAPTKESAILFIRNTPIWYLGD